MNHTFLLTTSQPFLPSVVKKLQVINLFLKYKNVKLDVTVSILAKTTR